MLKHTLYHNHKLSVLSKFGRIASVSTDVELDYDSTPLYATYEYANGTAQNSTTNLISKLDYEYLNYVDTYEYTYDANNNITQVKVDNTVKTKYTYDSLNQLSTCADKNTNTFTEYSYDNAGNITVVKTYALTSSMEKGALQSTNTYTYDATWKDKLATYSDGDTTYTFTYDEIGNPINYRNGMIMDWDRGRQLSSLTIGNKTVEYEYNADGLRTYKNDSTGYETIYYYDTSNNLIAIDQNSTVCYLERCKYEKA